MDVWVKQGVVTEIVRTSKKKQEILVALKSGMQEKAINYPNLTGSCQLGDEVIINTTAITLSLGTGGNHFVMGIIGHDSQPSNNEGHIMKLRYTPSQGRVFSVEEEESPYHHLFNSVSSIDGMPVIVGSLHSMLTPICIGIKHLAPQSKIAYLMSDQAALPMAFSNQVELLQEQNLLNDTITFNHAFGGDYEAVNVYSALLTAKHICKADIAIVLMGPGVVGTGTRWGTTALDQGIFLNAVHILKGSGIGLVRISFADQRERHLGISHQNITALTQICQHSCRLPIPAVLKDNSLLMRQLESLSKHNVNWVETSEFRHLLVETHLPLNSMGRNFSEDPFFFETALGAGLVAAWQVVDTIAPMS